MDMELSSSSSDSTMTMTMNMGDMNMSGDGNYDENAPWYLRTLPGRTGDFLGHAIPGLGFAGLGLGLLLLALWRSRHVPRGTTFAHHHIPEQDPVFLCWLGRICIMGTSIGMMYEIVDSDWPEFDSTALTHCALYSSYFILGICASLESQQRLPLDTHRGALVLACILQALIWQAHGSMKKLPADGALHIYLGYINGANAAVVAYSMRFTDSVMAYLAGWALLVLQGVWIFTASLYECCMDLHYHDVATILALLCLAIFLGIILAVVYCGPELSDQDVVHNKYDTARRGNFSVLVSSHDDVYDDNEL
jgi:hypothetical protein